MSETVVALLPVVYYLISYLYDESIVTEKNNNTIGRWKLVRLLEVHPLGENELEKTSDRYDNSWALICWFVIINYSIIIITIIPVVNILSLFDSNFSCCLINMIDCLIIINRLKVVLSEIIFSCKL